MDLVSLSQQNLRLHIQNVLLVQQLQQYTISTNLFINSLEDKIAELEIQVSDFKKELVNAGDIRAIVHKENERERKIMLDLRDFIIKERKNRGLTDGG